MIIKQNLCFGLLLFCSFRYFRNSKTALSLNSKIISVHLDSEKSSLAPVRSPTVSNYPILYPVIFSPTNYWYFMINFRQEFCFSVNTPIIVLKLFSGINTTADRPSCVNLSFHFFCPSYSSMFFDLPNRMFLDCPTISLLISAIRSGANAVFAPLFSIAL